MMKNLSLRNMLILLGAVIIALLALGLVSTLLNQIVPITIALVAGLVLGRLSARVDLLAAVREALRRDQSAKPAAHAAEKPAVADAEVQANAEAIKARLADQEEPEPTPEITDFVIKTEEEILAEARQREAELASKKTAYDPAAALEERRRRLLGKDDAKG
jgi:hypothetical protein